MIKTIINKHMKKLATLSKIGYAAGVYGCSQEYFLITYTTETRIEHFFVKGLYGEEERAMHEMEKLGYEVSWGASCSPQFKGEDRRRMEKLAMYSGGIEEYMNGNNNK